MFLSRLLFSGKGMMFVFDFCFFFAFFVIPAGTEVLETEILRRIIYVTGRGCISQLRH